MAFRLQRGIPLTLPPRKISITCLVRLLVNLAQGFLWLQQGGFEIYFLLPPFTFLFFVVVMMLVLMVFVFMVVGLGRAPRSCRLGAFIIVRTGWCESVGYTWKCTYIQHYHFCLQKSNSPADFTYRLLVNAFSVTFSVNNP